MTHSSERIPFVKRRITVYDCISITSIYTYVASIKFIQNSRLRLLTSIKFAISFFSGQLCMNSLSDMPSALKNNASKFNLSTILCSHNSHSSIALPSDKLCSLHTFDHRWKLWAWIRVWASWDAKSTLLPYINDKTFGHRWNQSIFTWNTVTIERCQKMTLARFNAILQTWKLLLKFHTGWSALLMSTIN